ncbi:MAG: DUF1571 domain-containing protein [Planctomycetota bacterium]|nr:DUF1571 domain-containing protein [Planctomycetota bacterium]
MSYPDDGFSAEPVTTATAPRRRTGCFLVASLLCGVLAAALWFVNQRYQSSVAASIDPEETRPVEIVTNQSANEEPAAKEITGVTAGINPEAIAAAKHPLLPLLAVAQEAIHQMEENVQDYKATVITQSQVDGKLGEENYMAVKIRHEREDGDQSIPFSVYTRFLKPASTAGQEAIWVDGQNDDKIIAHPAGMFNLIRLKLNPDGALAMQGNRYSIRHIGMMNLLFKMLEKGEQGLKNEQCQVRIERNVKVGDVDCTMLEIIYPEKTPTIDFHKARIFIDDARGLPIAYEGYLWPEEKGQEAPLLEKYIYNNIELNVGLTDKEFDPDNPKYNYPGGD